MFKFFQGKDGQFYFNVVAKNGEVVATSEGYTREEDAHRGSLALTNMFLKDNTIEEVGPDITTVDDAVMPTENRGRKTFPNTFDPGFA